MLNVENLTCGYGETAVLKNVSFTAEPNEKLFIIGPNGCGKTTLLRAVAGLIPFTGNVLIDGEPVTRMKRKETAKKIAMMSQLSAVYFSYTVYETVMQGRYAHMSGGMFKGESSSDIEAVTACLESTDISELKDKNIRELSGGQLQRVFLARAFAQEPQILLLDEPTNHLDFKCQLELMRYLGRWAENPGRIVIGVTHDINLSLAFGDRLLALKDGGVFAQGRSGELDLDLINHTFGLDVRAHMLQTLKNWE